MMELLGHMEQLMEEEELKVEKDRTDRWLTFLSLVNSHPLGDKDSREKFIDLIRPDDTSNQEIPKYETDISLLERLKAMQGGGMYGG